MKPEGISHEDCDENVLHQMYLFEEFGIVEPKLELHWGVILFLNYNSINTHHQRLLNPDELDQIRRRSSLAANCLSNNATSSSFSLIAAQSELSSSNPNLCRRLKESSKQELSEAYDYYNNYTPERPHEESFEQRMVRKGRWQPEKEPHEKKKKKRRSDSLLEKRSTEVYRMLWRGCYRHVAVCRCFDRVFIVRIQSTGFMLVLHDDL